MYDLASAVFYLGSKMLYATAAVLWMTITADKVNKIFLTYPVSFVSRVIYQRLWMNSIHALKNQMHLGYEFTDLKATLMSNITNDTRLKFSFYIGKDRLSFDPLYIDWGNYYYFFQILIILKSNYKLLILIINNK